MNQSININGKSYKVLVVTNEIDSNSVYLVEKSWFKENGLDDTNYLYNGGDNFDIELVEKIEELEYGKQRHRVLKVDHLSYFDVE